MAAAFWLATGDAPRPSKSKINDQELTDEGALNLTKALFSRALEQQRRSDSSSEQDPIDSPERSFAGPLPLGSNTSRRGAVVPRPQVR
jgi:hypothetical protein